MNVVLVFVPKFTSFLRNAYRQGLQAEKVANTGATCHSISLLQTLVCKGFKESTDELKSIKLLNLFPILFPFSI